MSTWQSFCKVCNALWDNVKRRVQSVFEVLLGFISNIIRYLLLLIASISIFVGRALLLENGTLEKDGIISDITRDIAISVFLSFIMIVLIERNSRQEQEKLTQKYLTISSQKVLEVVYGSIFPPSVFDDLAHAVLKMHFIYTEARVLIDIRDCGSEKYVCVDVKWEYTVKNTSANDDVFIFNFYQDAEYTNHVNDPLVVPLATRLTVNGEEYNEEQIRGMIVNGIGNIDSTHYSKELRLAPGESIKIQFESGSVRNIEDSYLFKVMKICLSFDVVITKNRKLNTQSDFISITEDKVDKVENDACIFWRANKAILPGNGVHIWWRKKA